MEIQLDIFDTLVSDSIIPTTNVFGYRIYSHISRKIYHKILT